jgi:molybdopterin-biosynthesis enzyme MoeA-like protein
MKLHMVTTIMTRKAIDMKLHKAIALKLHKATTGAMMSLAMSVMSSIKNKATATTAMMQMDRHPMAIVPTPPMDLHPMVLAPIPPMTTGNTMPSTIQGKPLPMAMTTIQDTIMMKMVIWARGRAMGNICNI